MSSLLRFLAALVAVSFVAACGEALPTDADGFEPFVAAEEGGEEPPPECDPEHPDFNEDECEGGWMGSDG